MQVFVTGGTGYVGAVLVEHLVRAGHQVLALARSAESDQALRSAGATPVRGSLEHTDVLRASADAADAVVHAAVDHAMTADAAATELEAVAALVAGAAAADARKPFVYTSSALVYGLGAERDTREDAELPQVSAQPAKAAAERVVTGAPRITGIVLRPGLVHGRGGSGLLTSLIGAAARSGAATYVDGGAAAWSSVHVDDLAALYLAALERPTGGVFNVAGSEFTFRELAEAIAGLTGASPLSVPLAEAELAIGPLARVVATTTVLRADRARTAFGWRPAGPSLLEDVRSGSYRGAVTSRPRAVS